MNNNCNRIREELKQALTNLITYLFLFTPQQPNLVGSSFNMSILQVR